MIKPSRCIATFVFDCPKCGVSAYVSWEEWRDIGKVLCVACCEVLELAPVEKITMHPVYHNIEYKKQEKVDREKTVDILVGMGFDRQTVKELVNEYPYQKNFVAEVVAEIIKEQD